MSVQTALPGAARKTLLEWGQVSLVIGIPSFNNSATIGHVARVASEGIDKYFSRMPALLMNSDGGSGDRTAERFLAQPTAAHVHKLSTRYSGIAGKGTAVRAILEAATVTGARAVVLVDSDLRSITPEWIRLLARSILDGDAEFVAPLYLRHKYDGTITNNLVYPFTRALYGKRIRQPIGGDFGLSGSLARKFLEEDVWQTVAAQFGIDIFMTTAALSKGAVIVQANLGAKIHDAKDPALHLAPMFRQVVGTMFSLMSRFEGTWLNVHASEAVPTVGAPVAQEPEPIPVNLHALIERFKEGVARMRVFWSHFIPADTLSLLLELARLNESDFYFPAELWVKLAYLFAVAFNKSGLDSGQVMDSLTPLYFGRTAAFVKETDSMDWVQAEQIIEQAAQLFEQEKQFLEEAWKTADRKAGSNS